MLQAQVQGVSSVHDELKVCQSSSLYPVVLDILGPHGALDVHQDPGLRALELHHHDGGEVAALVPVREVVAREAAERSVGHLQNELFNC